MCAYSICETSIISELDGNGHLTCYKRYMWPWRLVLISLASLTNDSESSTGHNILQISFVQAVAYLGFGGGYAIIIF